MTHVTILDRRGGSGGSLSPPFSSTRFDFETASTDDGFAAKSSFIQIGHMACRRFGSRLICIGLVDGREGDNRGYFKNNLRKINSD